MAENIEMWELGQFDTGKESMVPRIRKMPSLYLAALSYPADPRMFGLEKYSQFDALWTEHGVYHGDREALVEALLHDLHTAAEHGDEAASALIELHEIEYSYQNGFTPYPFIGMDKVLIEEHFKIEPTLTIDDIDDSIRRIAGAIVIGRMNSI